MKAVPFWLNKVLDAIEQRYPEGRITVSSGVTPSGTYHIGHLREVLTADAVLWGLKRRGREARHMHFVDDLDVFRKVPANIPAEYEQYLGKPLYLIPAPDGSDRSYADQYFEEFQEAMQALGVDWQVMRSREQYQAGKHADNIERTLQNMDDVREIIETISGRQLKRDWSPVQLLSDENRLDEWQFTGLNADAKTVSYVGRDGQSGEVSYTDGRVKLDWRLDWPSRWQVWGVNVEPFGRDHATKGGSYDTGQELVKRIFDATAPYPVPYEFINLAGQTKKMSASAGTGILPGEALKVMPPALLRYFVLKPRPGAQAFFDTGRGYGRLFDEFAKLDNAPADQLTQGEAELHALAVSGTNHSTMPNIPFNHLTTAYQSALGDGDKTMERLRQSEHDITPEQEARILEYLPYVGAWLEDWAGESEKFIIQPELPNVELSGLQREFLGDLAQVIETVTEPKDGEWYHNQVHELRNKHALEPKQAFSALYRVLLDRDSGPKAGWFLSILDHEWLVERLKQAADR